MEAAITPICSGSNKLTVIDVSHSSSFLKTINSYKPGSVNSVKVSLGSSPETDKPGPDPLIETS